MVEVIPYDNINSNIDLYSFVQGLKENAHSIKLYKIIFYIIQCVCFDSTLYICWLMVPHE